MTLKKHRDIHRWDEEVSTYFAILPKKDMYGYWFWLEKYYYMTEWHFGGYILFRGRCRYFDSKEKFWRKVIGRNWI